MKKIDWKKLLPYVVAIAVFAGFALAYCSPLLDGKVLQAGDVNNWKGAAQEALSYHKATGETTWWTNSMFGGMPTFQVTGSLPSGEWRSGLEKVFHLGFANDLAPIGIVFAYFFGFFLLLLCFGVDAWIALGGALVMGLSSYFMLIIPAGHITKAIGIGFLAPMIGGIYAIFRKNYFLGFPLVTLYGIAGLTLHPQMTYYMAMLIGLMVVAELYIHISEKRWKDLGVALGVVVLAMMLVMGTKISWMQMNQEYLKETMRGGHSELTSTNDNANATQKAGLDIDYATAWSYGKAETLTLLIPNYMGGCSGYDLGEGSQLENDLKKLGVPAKQAKSFCQGAPTYWGEKAFTSGPVYVGAIVCFLFILGLLIVGGPYKWALLAATIFSVLLAWGRNFMGFTELFYNYFPMYNKFRAVESILVVAEVTIPLLGFLALKEIHGMESDERKKKVQLSVLIAGGITAVICLFVALFGSGFDVTSSYDASWKGQVGDQIYNLILSQRQAMMTASAWRSLVFVVLGCALTYWYTISKKTTIFGLALAVLLVVDIMPVDKHFFNNDNFVTEKNSKAFFAEQPWETQILQDKTPNFRVLNVAANTFNDARTSYRLKSIGGYSAAKLRRYQDLIDAHISKNNWQVLNMLNTRYIVTREGVQFNPQAYGNAWFVNDVKLMDTPDEESQALWTLDLKQTAVADKQFATALDVSKPEVTTLMAFDEDKIELVGYQPNHLTYRSQNERNRVAVFSEIYYPHGWHIYIDGKEAQLARVNYTLRAAVIPAGEHKVTMEFVPDALKTDKWSLAILIIALLLSLGALGLHFYGKVRVSSQPAA